MVIRFFGDRATRPACQIYSANYTNPKFSAGLGGDLVAETTTLFTMTSMTCCSALGVPANVALTNCERIPEFDPTMVVMTYL